jgi:8-oxo-dGTP pyrophosphatase MutT (NUDIX family)
VSSSPRRPTADPEQYLIPAEHLPADYARHLEQNSAAPKPPRPASTVAVVRDAGDGLEALLLQRPRTGFAANAWVFPGGVVDDADADLIPASSSEPREWAGRLHLEQPLEAWAHVVAAVRETWEETGLWLGVRRPSSDLSLDSLRQDVVGGRIPFALGARSLGLAIDTEKLRYLARWITPIGEPRRYDTRFFVAMAPDEPVTLEGTELSDFLWIPPGSALSLYDRDELQMLPPTVHTLRRLAGFATVAELMSELRAAKVPSFLPRMRAHPDGILIDITEMDRT